MEKINVVELNVKGVEVNFLTEKTDVTTIINQMLEDLRNMGLTTLHDYVRVDEVYLNNKLVAYDLEILGYTCKYQQVVNHEQIDINSYLKGTVLE